MEEKTQKKLEKSLKMLVRGEKIALELNQNMGYYLAFSGGKDSMAVYYLAKMAGVKFKAFYHVTGIDDPENVYFIKKNFPDVTFIHPPQNYFQLVEKKGLPTIQKRFCCERLKERVGAGVFVLDGVRAEESRKRGKYAEVMVRSRRKENIEKGINRTLDEIEENEHQCIKGKDKLIMHPLLSWEESEVWKFLEMCEAPINPCYEKVKRVGCMYCPFAKREQIEMYSKMYPLYEKRLLVAIDRWKKDKTKYAQMQPLQILDWWLSHKKIDEYLKMGL